MFNQDENSLLHSLSTSIVKASVDLAKKRKKVIFIISKQQDNKKLNESKFIKWFEESIKSLKSTLSRESTLSLFDSPSATQALKDVTLVMSYIYDNHKEIIDSKQSFDRQIVDIVISGKSESLLLGSEEDVEVDENGETKEVNLTNEKDQRAECI